VSMFSLTHLHSLAFHHLYSLDHRIGCGDTFSALSAAKQLQLKSVIAARNKAERDLKMYTNLDWTIVRPGTLKNGPATGNVTVTRDLHVDGDIRREDAAQAVVRLIASTRAIHQEVSLFDPSLHDKKDKEEAHHAETTVFAI
jgi:hypothetical protein